MRQGAFKSWPKITYNDRYLVGHTLEDLYERIDSINWWLGLGPWTQIASPAQLAIWRKLPLPTPVLRVMAPSPAKAAAFVHNSSYMGPLNP